MPDYLYFNVVAEPREAVHQVVLSQAGNATAHDLKPFPQRDAHTFSRFCLGQAIDFSWLP